jgi:2',3'-cyclic-nucleotide 2'-phosphodiesterase/3'-nucleotidase
VEIRQALIEYATASGIIDPATFAGPNWKLVRAGVPVF